MKPWSGKGRSCRRFRRRWREGVGRGGGGQESEGGGRGGGEERQLS